MVLNTVKNDPFMDHQIEDDEDENLPDEYKSMAKLYFGEESPEQVDALVMEFRKAVEAKGWKVPNRKSFYRKFLRAGGLNIESGMKTLEVYLRQRQTSPQYFINANPEQCTKVLPKRMHLLLPHRDQHGRRIAYVKPGQWNPSEFKFCDMFSVGTMLNELVALEPKSQVAGMTVIVNPEGFGFKQFRNVTLDDMKVGASMSQESFPLWFRAIHVINAPRIFMMVFNILKQFMHKTVQESVKFHPSLESLHQDIDPSILPDCLGGTDGPYDHSLVCETVLKMEEFYKELRNVSI